MKRKTKLQLELPFDQAPTAKEISTMSDEEVTDLILTGDVRHEIFTALKIIKRLINENKTLINMVNPIGKELLQNEANDALGAKINEFNYN